MMISLTRFLLLSLHLRSRDTVFRPLPQMIYLVRPPLYLMHLAYYLTIQYHIYHPRCTMGVHIQASSGLYRDLPSLSSIFSMQSPSIVGRQFAL